MTEAQSAAPPVSKRALVFLFAVVFLDLMGVGILLPIIPYLVRQFRTDATTVGALSLSFSAAQFLASPVLGVLSDRYGRRPVLLISILGSAFGYFLFGIAGSLMVMFLSRILDGFTGGNISTAQAYIADVTPPADRAKNFGLIGAAFGLGFSVGPGIGGMLANLSLQAPAYAACALSLLTAIFGYFVLPESLATQHRRATNLKLADLSPVKPIREAFGRPELRLMLFSAFVLNFAFSGLQSNFAVFTLTRFGYTPQQNAWIFTFIGLCSAFTQGYLVRRIAPSVGERRLAMIGLGVLISGFLTISLAHAEWMLYLGVILVSGVGLATPSQMAILSRRVTAREQGWLLGTTQSVLSVTRLLGPMWAGAVFDLWGPGAPYATGAVWLSLAMALNWMAVRHSEPA